ncbi:MAG: glycosyltransferase family 4 protein [Dehalococcoidia bacterium]|nr:glycosyltransferase family 4 protein [Dehalococcoidia bacterium]
MRQKFLNDCAFRLNLKMINYLVTGTPLMAEHYSQNYGISVNKIKVIPNSINLARFQPGNYDCVKIREELGVPEGNKVVLFVHWLSERKGAHYLTEIISKVSDKNPHTTLIIIGDGPYHARLAQEINNTGLAKYARITGGVPNTEVSRYYAIADLFIMPSTDEGFPRVLLEAMAMGVPFVANDIGGVRDIVTARQLAFISPVGDIALFSDNIIRLLNDDKMRDELKAEGFAKVKEFEKQAVADLFAKMIAAK